MDGDQTILLYMELLWIVHNQSFICFISEYFSIW